jgi:hypothetical protein
MSYAVVQDVPASWEQYATWVATLERALPTGLIVHAAGPTDEGFRTIEVWESEAAWRAFTTGARARAPRDLPSPLASRELELAHLVVGDGTA